MTSYIITSDAGLEAAGPYTDCRIRCEVDVGTPGAPIWQPRAYRAVTSRTVFYGWLANVSGEQHALI